MYDMLFNGVPTTSESLLLLTDEQYTIWDNRK